MNWLKKAFTTVTNQPGAYYTVVSPPEFYEWRFRQVIPKGTKFTEKMPRSDAFTEGKVIAYASLPPESLSKSGAMLELSDDTPGMIDLTAGEILSPKEVMAKYQQIKVAFDHALDGFRQSTETQKYFTSVEEKPKLYRVLNSSVATVELQNFGPVKELKEKFAEVQSRLQKESYHKKWRAYEMENFRRFENYMMVLQNPTVPIDAPKMEFLLRVAGSKPIQTRKIPWMQCFLEISTEAKNMNNQIAAFNSLSWVKHSANYI
jgi:hypothetical protein